MPKKRNAIVFIDGNNLYHNLKKVPLKPGHIDYYKLSEALCSHFDCVHKQSRYYNSLPDIGDGEKRYYDSMRFLSGIEALPKFEVITRKLQKYDNKKALEEKREMLEELELCEVCGPLVETNCLECIGKYSKKEKGIDVRIAVDMLNLSVVGKECDCCILISGDADFIPASDIIKSHGKEVLSASVPRGYAYELRSKLKYKLLTKEFLCAHCLKDDFAD